MTDDITRGLAALADEAQPAPIDSHTVVQLAHAHTRARRAVLTAAFATLVAIGALTVAIGSWQRPGATTPATPQTTSQTTSQSPPTTRDTPTTERPPDSPPTAPEVRDTPSAAENAERKARLQPEMVAAFDRILPDGWQHSAFGFGCDQTGCFAEGDVIDGAGTTLSFFVYVSDRLGTAECYAPTCVRAEVLDDGTAVQLSKGEFDGLANGVKEATVGIDAQRPDGTLVSMSVRWSADKPTPALTDEQWMEFGKALTY
jgi:hypothetical protein